MRRTVAEAGMEHPGGLSCTSRVHGRQVVVRATGEIDLTTAPVLRETLSDLIDAGHCRLVVDLTEVTQCDSVGLGVLVGALKRARHQDAGGYVRLVCRGPVRSVLRRTGLDRIFATHDDLAGALGSENQEELEEEAP